MTRIRLLIADDHKMVSQALASLLSSKFEIVGTVADGKTLVEEAERLNPDVILADISMPVMNGLDAARALRSSTPNTKIVFLTMHADIRLMTEAFRSGGSGYVLKQSAGEELTSAIEHVIAGNEYISPVLTSEWQRLSPEVDEKKRNLTPRQREVLSLISQGFTMKQISTRLGISTRTVESYKYEMMAALEVESTAELIRYAVILGLTDS